MVVNGPFWDIKLEKYKNLQNLFIWFSEILGNEKRSKGN